MSASAADREQRRRRALSSRWRVRALAVAAVSALHLGLLGVVVSDWASHRVPAPPDIVSITLERPDRPVEPPPPPPPPPRIDVAPPAPRATQALPFPAPFTFTVPAAPPARPGGLVGIPGPAAAPATALGPLDLGCLNPSLTGKAKEDCDRKVHRQARPAPGLDEEDYAVLDPRVKAELKPGFKPRGGPPGTIGLGFTYIYGPNDKHFLPFQGDTKTTVFDRAEIYNVPKPMQ